MKHTWFLTLFLLSGCQAFFLVSDNEKIQNRKAIKLYSKNADCLLQDENIKESILKGTKRFQKVKKSIFIDKIYDLGNGCDGVYTYWFNKHHGKIVNYGRNVPREAYVKVYKVFMLSNHKITFLKNDEVANRKLLDKYSLPENIKTKIVKNAVKVY